MEEVDQIKKKKLSHIDIIEVKDISKDVVLSLQKLLPQLTINYKSFDQKDLEEILDSQCTRLFTAIDRNSDNQIVGSFSLVIFRIATGRMIRIEDVVVDESRRGEGIGRKMMEHALNLAKKTGNVKIELYSHPTRVAADELYQSLDFKILKANLYRYVG